MGRVTFYRSFSSSVRSLFILKLLRRGSVVVAVHLLHRVPPHRTLSVIPVALYISRPARVEMPVKMRVTHSEKFVIHLFRTERPRYRLRDYRHLLHELRSLPYPDETALSCFHGACTETACTRRNADCRLSLRILFQAPSRNKDFCPHVSFLSFRISSTYIFSLYYFCGTPRRGSA